MLEQVERLLVGQLVLGRAQEAVESGSILTQSPGRPPRDSTALSVESTHPLSFAVLWTEAPTTEPRGKLNFDPSSIDHFQASSSTLNSSCTTSFCAFSMVV